MTLTNVTIYRQGMFGVHRTDCKTVEITTGQKYAQYNNATKVVLLEKGKRKLVGFMLTNHTDTCIIVDTREAVPVRDPLSEPDERGNRMSRYTSFDKAYWRELEEDLRANQTTVCFDYTKGYPVSA